jgi:PD-(D/E)XK endonuclease
VSTVGMLAEDVTGDKRLPVFRCPAPPLSLLPMLTTNQKGALAECIKLGVPVCRPIDDQRYDLVLDLGTRFLRVQCKWAARRHDVIEIRCRRCRRGPSGLIHERYAADEIDALAGYCAATGACYLLPYELSVERAAVYLRLEPTKNNQSAGVRWARDYDFAAKMQGLLGR